MLRSDRTTELPGLGARQQSPEIVFELVIEDKSEEDPVGWAVYRSGRFPSLYPWGK